MTHFPCCAVLTGLAILTVAAVAVAVWVVVVVVM